MPTTERKSALQMPANATLPTAEARGDLLAYMCKLDAGLQQVTLKLESNVLSRLDALTEQQDRSTKLGSEQYLRLVILLESILQEKAMQREDSGPTICDIEAEDRNDGPMPAKPSHKKGLGPSHVSLRAKKSTTPKGTAGKLAQPGGDVVFEHDASTNSYLHNAASSESSASKHVLQEILSNISSSDEEPTPPSENLFAEDARLHWRRMIRREISHKQLPLSKASQTDMDMSLRPMQRFFRSRAYEIMSVLLVVLNATFIGWQVEHFAEYHVVPEWQLHAEFAFCVVFTLELLLRLSAEKAHVLHKDFGWNVFDVVVVLTMLAEQIVTGVSAFKDSTLLPQMSILRVLRLLRVVRVLKLIRVGFFRELRMMVQSVLHSIKSLTWAMVVQGVMFYIFGISLTQGVVDYCERTESWASWQGNQMLQHFGTLGRSTLSLFEAMTGGIAWGELIDAIVPLDFAYKVIFVLYICMAIFAVANIVTAVFVESAMQNAQRDREAVIEDQMESNKAYLKNMKKMFHELDRDGDAMLTIKELRHAVKDERVVAYLNAFGLDITDVHTLFVLLDRDQSGMIDIDEFLLGCMRLKGGASSLDLAKMQYECEWMVHNIETLVVSMDTLVSFLTKFGLQPQRPDRSRHFAEVGSMLSEFN